MDSHALAWPLELGFMSWGYALPRCGVAPQVRLMDTHALA